MFNIGSLVLGVGAWLFAGLAITTPKVSGSHKSAVASFSLCVVSLVFQLCEINGLVIMGDFAAIEDTVRARLIAAVALVSVTVILNFVALVKGKNK